MNNKLMVGVLTLTLSTLIITRGSQVYAADSTASPAPFLTRCGQAWGTGAGIVSDAITKLLGMNQNDIEAKRQAGESMAKIAADKGVNQQQLIKTLTQARADHLNQAVKDGYLTQDEANERSNRMKQNIETNINNTGFGVGHRGFMGGIH